MVVAVRGRTLYVSAFSFLLASFSFRWEDGVRGWWCRVVLNYIKQSSHLYFRVAPLLIPFLFLRSSLFALPLINTTGFLPSVPLPTLPHTFRYTNQKVTPPLCNNSKKQSPTLAETQTAHSRRAARRPRRRDEREGFL